MRNNTIGLIATILIIAISENIYAQEQQETEPILMTVDGEDVSRSEFENIYKKNNRDNEVTKEALDEYVELFVNFKLKVREAESLGMDTVGKFVSELDGYRDQLARPYMVDTAMTEALVNEAYRRSLEEVRASHILAKLSADPTPEDTVKAYEKIIALRERVMAGEGFGVVASEKNGSDDPSAVQNKGDLGYFTALQMVYPFENAVYNTKVGEISGVVRTRFGYHIIKVTDRRPARGQIKVAHIMIRSAEKDSADKQLIAEQKINEVYAKVLQGDESFAELALKYSDDEGSAKKGGELPMFSTGKMIEEFENASFALENDGDISKPFRSRYGWHIVKRIEYKGVSSFEEMEPELRRKVAKDSRAQLSEESFIKKLNEEYNYTEYRKNLTPLYKLVNDNIFMRNTFEMDTMTRKDVVVGDFFEDGVRYERDLRGTLVNGRLVNIKSKKHEDVATSPEDTVVVRVRNTGWELYGESKLDKKLITIGDTMIDQRAFVTYLEKTQRKGSKVEIKDYVNKKFNEFAEQEILNYEDSRLEEKYPEFSALMKEYRDGILLFELTDEKVWSKAVKDTTGLNEFYEANKQDFMWPERIGGTIYTCASAKVAEKTKNLVKMGKSISETLTEINQESQLDLKVEAGRFAKEDQAILGKVTWEVGVSENVAISDQVVFVAIDQVIEPQPKELNEAKGAITAAYQDQLEEDWITELRTKYLYTINKEVLYSIK